MSATKTPPTTKTRIDMVLDLNVFFLSLLFTSAFFSISSSFTGSLKDESVDGVDGEVVACGGDGVVFAGVDGVVSIGGGDGGCRW